MDQKVIVKITLPPEEILAIRWLLCPIDGCTESFTNASHLQMHANRRHKLPPGSISLVPAVAGTQQHYHCPEDSCLYHVSASGEKFFTSFRSLKQHFLKMHSEKIFVCGTCNGQKSFATESLLRAHQANCGQSFVCNYCGHSYGSREALLTHTKRKNHGYEELLSRKSSKRKAGSKVKQEIVPAKVIKQEIEQSSVTVQTEDHTESKVNVLVQTDKTSQTTQTQNDKTNAKVKSECSTQTAAVVHNLATSIHAPTTDNFCQTNLDQFSCFEDNTNLSTCFENPTTSSPASSESVTCVCTETQTDLIYDEMFPNEDRTDPMLYSHMYTQTCEDIFSDLALTTIETQTHWEDGLGEFLVSTQTQTGLINCPGPGTAAAEAQLGDNRGGGGAGAGISSSQTQTSASMEFLNAISAESSSIHTQTS